MILPLALIGALVGAAPNSDRPPTLDYWQHPARCGPNSLYGYLSIHGATPRFDAIARLVPLAERGSNLRDLASAATRLGVPSVVLQATATDLDALALPAIVHYATRLGHYRLLLQVDGNQVTTADMTTGQVDPMTRSEFLERWSGFVIVPDQSGPAIPRTLAIGTLLGGIVLLGSPSLRGLMTRWVKR